MLDCLIIGQGVAGSLLAWHLAKAQKTFMVIDETTFTNASLAASGIINPITGKRWVKSWLIEKTLPYAKKCYSEIENTLKVSFAEELTIKHILHSIQEVNDWCAKSAIPEYREFLPNPERNYLDTKKVFNPFGYFQVLGALKIEPTIFLNAIKRWLCSKNAYRQEYFDETGIEITQDGLLYKDLSAGKIIFANGYKAKFSQHFEQVKFSPAKGEGLLIEINDFYEREVIQGQVMISPTFKSSTYYAGSTYEWLFEDDTPTEKQKAALIKRIEKTIVCDYSVKGHVAGIRPATNNRRPIIGCLPHLPRIGIFNGMGTKGYSLAPYFAHHFCQHLFEEKNLMPEVDVKRFF
jgi:glycine/D-amino acid oxidase-like deaminating enzyme